MGYSCPSSVTSSLSGVDAKNISFQVVQNESMRAVYKREEGIQFETCLRRLIHNWLSVQQLVFYHSVIQAWMVINTRHPVYLHSRLVGNWPRYADRLAAAGSLIRGRRPRIDLIESSWRWRVAQYWEELPRSIKEIDNESSLPGQNPTITRSGRKVTQAERKRK